MNCVKTSENACTKILNEKIMAMTKADELDDETIKNVERMVVLRISTKHINLWVRQLEMKRREMSELAGLIGLDEIKREIASEKSLERWAKRCTNSFTKNVKRMIFGEIDNFVWSGKENEVIQWCQRNRVFDEITEDEIEEIWHRENPDDDENIRLNGKYVWDTAKRVCDFINAHEDLITITSFSEYRGVMRKVMRVIKEAHNTQRKRRLSGKKKMNEEARKRTQQAKALSAIVKQGKMSKVEVMRRLEEIFGRGSSQEIEKATTKEKIAERIEELAKREQQFEVWEKMRQEAKRRQREDRRLNIFWRKNKAFPTQFGGEDVFPDAEETLTFWRTINNKEVSEAWREDESLQEVLREVREKLQRRSCEWGPFTEEEFDEVLRCTAPWKACGVDSIYSFPIKKCPPIKKAVFQLVKRLMEWRVIDNWDDENNWLLEGRTVLIYKGGDRKDPANYRPITCLPTITKMVTLAIHKRMRGWLFGSFDSSILECEQRGVRTSQGCKEAVIENIASNVMKKKEGKMLLSSTATSRKHMIT